MGVANLTAHREEGMLWFEQQSEGGSKVVVLPRGLEMVRYRQIMHGPAHPPHNKRWLPLLWQCSSMQQLEQHLPGNPLSMQWPEQEFLQFSRMQRSKQELLRACDQQLHSAATWAA